MSRLLAVFFAFSLAAVLVLYYAGLGIYHSLSPQGCRMSWMWPSYVLQTKFDHTWTPLARRYSLWLYREANRESHELHGAPVLFIPGNAGSSHQARSIASSAANQYYSSPYEVSPEFANEKYSGLDFFAVEFNEDLSAFHGPTIDSETTYATRAIDYILSLYPPNTSIIVMGHSMGGVVATALLPNPNISAIITMSTPHILPPVRFDRRIDHIYAQNHKHLAADPTPVLSLCGGATDLMIPSESCILSPTVLNFNTSLYRRTVFTSALEGCWTGVGHLAMVWCHQVRWRVARAALEIAAVQTVKERALVMDRWLRDGHVPPPVAFPTGTVRYEAGQYRRAPANQHLLIRDPVGTETYALPLPPPEEGQTMAKFVLYASQGSVPPLSPHHPLPFRATVYLCDDIPDLSCTPLDPTTLKLIPSPMPGLPFPVPDEGSDESEGVVLYEADVPLNAGSLVAVTIERGDRRGWVFGGYAESEPMNIDVGLTSLLLSSVDISLPSSIRVQINLPIVPANALLVYRLTPGYDQESSCTSESVLSPLLAHTSHPSETHYFPLAPNFGRRILLHSHAAGPYITSDHPVGHTLTVHTSGECLVNEIQLTVDWWAAIGRWGSRYGTAAACWAVGIMAVLMWDVQCIAANGAPIPDVQNALEFFARRRLPLMVMGSYFVSLLPLRVSLWLGNGGNHYFAPLAMILLPITFGLVCVMWLLLRILLWPLQRLLKVLGSRREDTAIRRPRTAILSMGLIFLVIFILVPWQVAYLGCWLIHFYTCASSLASLPSHTSSAGTEAVPLIAMPGHGERAEQEVDVAHRPTIPQRRCLEQQINAHLHLLLLMTWLLPLVAPVLAVWVRTLATAGFTTPFDGDHNFLYVAPFLILVEVLSGGEASVHAKAFFGSGGKERVSPRWGFAALAVIAFFTGPRTTYMVFETASVAVGWVVTARVVPVYWGATS
ncbi:PGAP1-domain-containing protein [Lentinus brumalis]|uniref:GPI inositol-deacylase n=1 Tax=Lentinus brumalis TaxID=2498619 RepID=A0A371DMK6_9APHY|nr:PGAP1-domain-containing protein [Polyporus brumalis]